MINRARLLETFFEYVKIDSETGNEKAMADRVAADLAAIGCEVATDRAGEAIGSNGYNIYATLYGENDAEPIMMSSHLDTVAPGVGIEPYAQDGVIRSRGETILGGDDKSGVAAIIEALRCVAERRLRHRTVEAVFTICEEGGLRGAQELEYGRIQSKNAAVFVSGGGVGGIITTAPGQIRIDAGIIRRAAPAGVNPEDGVSAIVVAAHAVASMKLLRIDSETTANIGTFLADGPTNIVTERVKFRAEARSRNQQKLEAQAAHMASCLEKACETFGAKLHCRTQTCYIGYHVPKEHRFVCQVMRACEAIGVEPVTASSGGGSDANIMAQNGITAVVLGTGMDRVHTIDEQITIDNLNHTARLALQLMLA